MLTHDALKHDAPDAALLDALQNTPGLLDRVQAGAQLHYAEIMKHHLALVMGVPVLWRAFTDATHAKIPNPRPAFPAEVAAARAAMIHQLRAALEYREIFADAAADMPRISGADMLGIRNAGDSPARKDAAIRHAMLSHPGLAAMRRRLDGMVECHAAGQAADQDRVTQLHGAERTQSRVIAAHALLRTLAQAGIALALTGEGITAKPAAMLLPEQNAALRELRDEITAILDQPPALVA